MPSTSRPKIVPAAVRAVARAVTVAGAGEVLLDERHAGERRVVAVDAGVEHRHDGPVARVRRAVGADGGDAPRCAGRRRAVGRPRRRASGRISCTGIGRAIATTVWIAHELAALLAVELHEVELRLGRQAGSERQARSRRRCRRDRSRACAAGHEGRCGSLGASRFRERAWQLGAGVRKRRGLKPGPLGATSAGDPPRGCVRSCAGCRLACAQHAAEITTTHRPATDLGYLLHKNPDRVQTFDVAFGAAHVFYPGGERRALHGGAAARRRPGRPGARRGRGAGASRSRSTSTTGRTSRRRSCRSRSASVFGTAMAGREQGAAGARRHAAPARGRAAGRCRAAAARRSCGGSSSRSATRSTPTPLPLDPSVPRVGRQPLPRPSRLRGDAAARATCSPTSTC